jgi:Papain family cysteine protease
MNHATRPQRFANPATTGLAWSAIVALAASCGGAVADALPHSVDLTPEFQKQGLVALAQGKRDDCSLFAVTGVVEFECARRAMAPHGRLSEEFLIWASDKATGQTGDQAMFYNAVQGLNTYGICAAELMPYDDKPNPHRQASPRAMADARKLRERWRIEWIKRWSVDRQLTERELLAIKHALVNGHPVACGLRWPKNLNGDKLLIVPPTKQVFDGHSIVFVGYEDGPGQPGGGLLRFRNSFGEKWGDHGYGTMSYAYARTYANDAICLHLGPPESETPTVRYEAETMPVLATVKCEASPQKMNDFGRLMWSKGEQLCCRSAKGGFVELGFDVHKPGRYRVRLLATAAPDYGVVRVGLDGRTLPHQFDLYCGRVSPAGSLELGTHELAPGRHRLRVTAISKDAAAKGLFFGLDALDLIAAK